MSACMLLRYPCSRDLSLSRCYRTEGESPIRMVNVMQRVSLTMIVSFVTDVK
jgi:hypothetical protein